MPVLECAAAIDFDQLREVTMDDEALIREILGALWEDTSAQIGKLAAAVQNGDSEQCMRLAHYSKGACANVGANAAAEVFRQIEAGARARDFGACAESLAALGGAMQQLKAEIAAF